MRLPIYDLQSPRGLGVGLAKSAAFARRAKATDGCKVD